MLVVMPFGRWKVGKGCPPEAAGAQGSVRLGPDDWLPNMQKNQPVQLGLGH